MIYPELLVTDPDGRQRPFQLTDTTIVIGRSVPGHHPDLDLSGDGSVVSRVHCVLEAELGSWWVTDNASRNGTFVRDGSGEVTRVDGRRRLDHGEVVIILGRVETSGQQFWELRLVDPNATAQVGAVSTPITADGEPCLRWSPAEVKVETVIDGASRVIELRKQGYSLVGYMSDRNAGNGGVPVVCAPDELLEAVWGQPDEWDKYHPPTVENLRDLISDVRRAVEPDPKRPVLIENLRGVGYRLKTCG